MSKKEKSLTSIKLDNEIYEEFRINCIKYKTNLAQVTEIAIHLYNKDEEFRRKINNTKI